MTNKESACKTLHEFALLTKDIIAGKATMHDVNWLVREITPEVFRVCEVHQMVAFEVRMTRESTWGTMVVCTDTGHASIFPFTESSEDVFTVKEPYELHLIDDAVSVVYMLIKDMVHYCNKNRK